MSVRRYSNFVWLRDMLVLENPGCLIPPIPEKENIKGVMEKVSTSNAPSTLVAYRMRSLRKFLVRVGAHAKLQNSELLYDFLSLSDDEFSKRMKLPSKVTQEIVSISATLRVSTAMASAPTTQEYQKWDSSMIHFEKFEGLLMEMREKMNKMMHQIVASGKTLKDFGLAYSEVKEIEGAKESQDLAAAMAPLAGPLCDKQDRHSEEWAFQLCIHVAESVTYYQGMCQAVLCAIRRLLKLQHTRDILDDEHRKTAAKPDPAAKERAEKLKAQQEEAATKVTEISEELAREMARFQREKAYDFKTILSTYVDLNKEFGKKTAAVWQGFLKDSPPH